MTRWLKAAAILLLAGPLTAGPTLPSEKDSFETVDRQFRASFFYSAGLAASLRGYNAESLALLKRASQADPDSAFLLRELASASLALEKWEDARDALKRALELDATDQQSRQDLAGVLIKMGEAPEAKVEYGKALTKDPGNAEAAYRLSKLQEAAGDDAAALETLRRALAANPKNAMLRDAQARAFYRMRRYEEAEKAFTQILKADPKDPESLLMRGMALLQQKKFKLAQADFEAAGSLAEGNPSQLYGLGLALMWQEKYKEAENAFSRLLELQPKAVPAYIQLSFIYDKTTRTAEARKLLEKGVAENPASGELYLLLGAAQLDAKETKRAEKTYVDGIKNTSDNGPLRFQLAVLYDKGGNFAKARKELEALIQAEPKNAPALNYLGYSLVERNIDLKKGEALIQRALVEEPGNRYYLDSLGWAHFKSGRYAEALGSLQQAAAQAEAQGPEEAVVFEHLASTYEKLGDKQKAQDSLEKARRMRSAPTKP